MAQVFLSYDREDGAKARVIAQALERAGHFVWWDLHIKGGAEYGKVIEQALADADCVVVLWSRHSVDSAWVRDEAAAGRDSGRLIPILLEPVSPPMGFRQYQNLDFSTWKGRGKPPHMVELLSSIEGLGERASDKPTAAPAPAKSAPRPTRPLRKWLAGAGIAIVALVAIGLFVGLVLNAKRSQSTPVVAIAAASASEPARALARDLLAKLGNLHSTQTDSLKLVQGASDQKNADLVFEVDGTRQGDVGAANLILLSGKDRALLWSKNFARTKQADLDQQLAYTAAKVLDCAVEALTSEGARLRQETLKLYLNGCSSFAEVAAADPRPLVPIFRAVVKQAPRFEGAWAKLLHTEAGLVTGADWHQPDVERVKAQLLQDMEVARKLNPDLAELLLAEANLLPRGAFARRRALLERAVEQNPDNAFAHIDYSTFLMKVGRGYESVEEAKRGAQLDPLSPYTRDAVISALAYSGELEAALEELRKAEQLWPGASNLLGSRYRIHLRYGDPKEALRIQRTGNYGGPHRDAFLQARLDPTPANIDKAISYPREWIRINPLAFSELAQVLGAFGREEELFSILLNRSNDPGHVIDVLFRPSLRNFRHDPRMMAVSKRLGLLDYWRQSGEWPDFCLEPDLPYDCKTEAAKLG